MTVKPTRLSDQIAEQIRLYIIEQNLQPEDRLPAERKLVELFGVSRSSIREGIQKLISAGVLYSRQGGGTYVRTTALEQQWADNSFVKPLASLFSEDPEYRYDVLEARYAIERCTAWHAALRATDADKEKIKQCFEKTIFYQEQGNSELASQADAHFHLAIAEASHNLVLVQIMRGLFDLLQRTVTQARHKMYTVPHTFSELVGQHQAIMDAIMEGDAEKARDAIGSHLDFVDTTVRKIDDNEARQERMTRLTSRRN